MKLMNNSNSNYIKGLEHWFPKWAVPPPGGRWDYVGGALEVGPSERVVRSFTIDQAGSLKFQWIKFINFVE
jgi:hypothetical protein